MDYTGGETDRAIGGSEGWNREEREWRQGMGQIAQIDQPVCERETIVLYSTISQK